MRVVFFGSGEFAVPSMRWLINSPHELAGVVTQPDRPAGRGKVAQPTPVAERAAQEGLCVERCDDVNAPAFVKKMATLQADLGVVIAFGQKLLEPLRSVFTGECINLHASLLPKYRGASPIHRAVLAGDRQTGVSVFRLVDRMDAGPVLLQRTTMIGPEESCQSLHDRLAGICCDALGATLQLLEQDPKAAGEPQDEARVTWAPKLNKQDGYIRFDQPAENIARLCRAMWSWPGARCRYIGTEGRSEDVTIAEATALPGASEYPPGTITPVLTVATATGTLEIHSLQPAGKRIMGWQDFVNGRHVQPGERFAALD
ncbi:MAG: methionyl-tRNA formyltransferase [Phycisphaerales bacterium]|nr:methionyl-tRNA formyltransferase [Phycisphaerales bacterium]